MAALLLVGACDRGTTGPPAPDGVPETVLPLIEKIVTDLVEDAEWVSNFSHAGSNGVGDEAAYSHSLPGSPFIRGFLFLIPDPEPGVYQPYCTDLDPGDPPNPSIAGLRGCIRVEFSEESLPAVDTYFVAHLSDDPDPKHPFVYMISEPVAGTIRFTENPLVRWEIEFPDQESSIVETSLSRKVTFMPQAADMVTFSLSHTARVTARHGPAAGGQPDIFEIEFPSLATDGPVTVELEVELIEPFAAEGRVLLGGLSVAEISGTATALDFFWRL